MDEDRITGAGKTAAGKVQETAGKVTGDAKTEIEGKVRTVAGKVENLFGRAKDATSDAVDDVADAAISLEGQVRDKIETNPFIALACAFGAGVVLTSLLRSDKKLPPFSRFR